MPEPTHNPQLTAARALVELLTQHPDLPHVAWHISDTDDALSGSVLGADNRALFAAYVSALGGEPHKPTTFDRQGRARVGEWLFTTWRNVPVSLSVSSDAAAYPELVEQVAA